MKTKKLKKIKLIAVIIAVIILILAVVGIIKLFTKEKNNIDENTEVKMSEIELPNTTYRGMEVININMHFLDENNQTEITMTIKNNTEIKLQDETLNAYLINDNSEVIGQLPTYIAKLDPEEEYSISVILNGDLTSTTQIKLEEIKK